MSAFATKVVLITGGSSGLGLHLAKQFCKAGARVIIVGRDDARLDTAVKHLGGQASSVAADVTSDQEVAAAFDQVKREYGRLDVLVNCAGRSMRGLAAETTPNEFQELWDINFLSVVRCTLAALPMLDESKGSLVNIGSLASKTVGQHLGAYPASKFPVAAYSQQLRIELAGTGIHVLLVCPGPIRRDEAGSRYDDEAGDLPAAARKPGGGVKIKALDPEHLAREIVRACARRKPELVLPRKARLLFAVSQLWPAAGDWLLKKSSS